MQRLVGQHRDSTGTAWDDLELVQHWRGFLDSPRRYLRHLLD